jgi:hypothetical protein
MVLGMEDGIQEKEMKGTEEEKDRLLLEKEEGSVKGTGLGPCRPLLHPVVVVAMIPLKGFPRNLPLHQYRQQVKLMMKPRNG